MLVPAYHCRLGPSVHRSVGTSSATLVLISGRGAMAYVVLGREEAGRLVGASRDRSAPGGGNHGGLLTVPFGKFLRATDGRAGS